VIQFDETLPTRDRWKVSERLNELLPPSWGSVRLGDIARVQNGAPFKSKLFNRTGEGMPLIRIRDVGADGTSTFYSGDYDDAYVVRAGDILIGMDGEFRCRRWRGRAALLNQRVCRLLVDATQYEPSFLLAFIQPYLDAVEQVTSSITVKHLSSKTVADLRLPAPPLPEQRRIVTRIESLQARSRRAREAVDAIPPLLERFRQSVLAAAFRGDLTADWRRENPDVEPASVLLERIRAERKRRWLDAEAEKARSKAEAKAQKAGKPWTETDDRKALEAGRKRVEKRYKEPEPVDPQGLPKLPEGWCWAALGEVGIWSSGGTPSRRNPDYYGGEIPWAKTGELRDGPITEVGERITEAGLANSAAKLFPAGTILVAMYGATIGRIGVLTFAAATNQACAALLPDRASSTSRDYLFWFLRGCQEAFRALGQGGAQPNISQTVLKAFPIPIPPPPEQAAVANRCAEQFQAIDAAEMGRAAAVEQLDRLGQSVLAKAFRGELLLPSEGT